jgi:hypothetical protein
MALAKPRGNFRREVCKSFIAGLDEIAGKETVANSAKIHGIGKCRGAAE